MISRLKIFLFALLVFNIVYLLNHQSKLTKLQNTINKKYKPKLQNIKENLKDGLGLQNEIEPWRIINPLKDAINEIRDLSDGSSDKESKDTTGNVESDQQVMSGEEPLSPYVQTKFEEVSARLKHSKANKISLDLDRYPIEKYRFNPLLSYDPRVTFWVYLNEISRQLPSTPVPSAEPHTVQKTTANIHKTNAVVPFSWSDWVDMTYLNNELIKPVGDRKTCNYLAKTHHVQALPNYCTDSKDLTMKDLLEMHMPDFDYFPGFVIRHSPDNKASNEVRMYEGKGYLLSYAPPPLKMIWLSKEGGIEVNIEGKGKMVDRLLGEVLEGRNGTVEMDPVEVFNDVTAYLGQVVEPVKEEEPKEGPKEEVKDPKGEVTDPKEEVNKPKEESKSEAKQQAKTKRSNLHSSLDLDVLDFQYPQAQIDYQVNEFDERLTKLFELTTNELRYNETEIEEYKLTRNEKLYYQGLLYANSYADRKEPTYFHMGRLNFDPKDKHHDAGWHYDWRFFNGGMKYVKPDWNYDQMKVRNKIILERLLRNWFKFSHMVNAVNWIAHGPLLAWYWDGLLFPFDNDIDVQMPIGYLVDFCRDYNQTLVVEDVNEGFGKYFLDCSSFLHHRYRTTSNNHIDARFIDVDTGSYIDITGLSSSTDLPPKKYQALIKQAESEGLPKPVYNCRHSHFSAHHELVPLRLTKLNGVPVYVPNRLQQILQDEYSDGLQSYEYDGWYFVDRLRLWVHGSNISHVYELGSFDADDKKIKHNMLQFISTLGDNAFDLLEIHDIADEYYLTWKLTNRHTKEMKYLFDTTGPDVKDVGAQLDEPKENWTEFSESVEFGEPMNMALFNYEYLERFMGTYVKASRSSSSRASQPTT